jgi:hypothetical protein
MIQDLYYSQDLSSPQEGQIIWDSESGCLVTYRNGYWLQLQQNGFPLLQRAERVGKLETIFNKLKNDELHN